MRALRLIGILPVPAADLESKPTLSLLSNLRSLQSAQSRTAGPLAAVPAGQ